AASELDIQENRVEFIRFATPAACHAWCAVQRLYSLPSLQPQGCSRRAATGGSRSDGARSCLARRSRDRGGIQAPMLISKEPPQACSASATTATESTVLNASWKQWRLVVRPLRFRWRGSAFILRSST